MRQVIYDLFVGLPLSFFLAICILYAPALALFPRLLHRPFYFSLIPVLSYFLIGCLSYIFIVCGLFRHDVVLTVSLVLFVVALCRGYLSMRSRQSAWQSADWKILAFNAIFLIPMILLALFSAFSINDALGSWNHWAKLAYFSLPDVQHMYPTFYPHFLAYAYQFLGSLQPEGIVKVLLVFFIFSILNVIAFFSTKTKDSFLRYVVVLLLIIFPGNEFFSLGMYHFYAYGYADPLLAATVVTSGAAMMFYCTHHEDSLLLIIAIAAAIASAWTKQPGLLWAAFVIPAILVTKMLIQKKIKFREMLSIIVVLSAVLFWLLGPGRHFYQNQGVIGASLGARHSFVETFFYAIKKYFIEQPTLLLIFILGFCAAAKSYCTRIIAAGMVVGLILWFTFASYDVREGLYLIGLTGLLIAYADFFAEKTTRIVFFEKLQRVCAANSLRLLYVFAILMLLVGTLVSLVEVNKVKEHIYPFNGACTTLCRYFYEQPDWVYQTLYQDDATIVAGTSVYEKSLFLGKKPVIMIDSADPKAILAKLSANKVEFVMAVPANAPDYYEGLRTIADKCPEYLQQLSLGKTRADYVIFKFNANARNKCQLDKPSNE